MTNPGVDVDMRDLEQVAEHVHDGGEIKISEVAEGEGESKLAVNKITWAQVGLVTEPVCVPKA